MNSQRDGPKSTDSASILQGRRLREEKGGSLRKERRDLLLAGKRRRTIEDGDGHVFLETEVIAALNELKGVNKEEAVRLLRRVLCVEDPPIALLVQHNIIQGLIACLMDGTGVLDALWCITNLACGNHDETQHCLDSVPSLILLLGSPNIAFQEQASWALANIASDCAEFRDRVRANGAILPLVNLLVSARAIRNSAFALASIVRRSPEGAADVMKLDIAQALVALLQSTDEDALTEIAWLLAYLTGGDGSHILPLLQAGLSPVLIQLLGNTLFPPRLHIPVLRVVGNIISKNEMFTALMLDQPGCAAALLHLLTHEHRGLQKEGAYVLSNIASGPEPHVKFVIQSGLLDLARKVFINSSYDVRRELGYVLVNVACRSQEALGVVCDSSEIEVVGHFLQLLEVRETPVCFMALAFIELVLRSGTKGVLLVMRLGGIDQIEQVQYHSHDQLLVQRAANLVDEFFGEDVEEIAP